MLHFFFCNTYICDASSHIVLPFQAVRGSDGLVLVALQGKYTWWADEAEEENVIGHYFKGIFSEKFFQGKYFQRNSFEELLSEK